MPKYRVTMAKVITCTVDVEADDESAAIEEAYQEAPHSICAQCSGWGREWGVNDDGQWETLRDFHGQGYSIDAHGPDVEEIA
jgi:hypothetical protein